MFVLRRKQLLLPIRYFSFSNISFYYHHFLRITLILIFITFFFLFLFFFFNFSSYFSRFAFFIFHLFLFFQSQKNKNKKSSSADLLGREPYKEKNKIFIDTENKCGNGRINLSKISKIDSKIDLDKNRSVDNKVKVNNNIVDNIVRDEINEKNVKNNKNERNSGLITENNLTDTDNVVISNMKIKKDSGIYLPFSVREKLLQGLGSGSVPHGSGTGVNSPNDILSREHCFRNNSSKEHSFRGNSLVLKECSPLGLSRETSFRTKKPLYKNSISIGTEILFNSISPVDSPFGMEPGTGSGTGTGTGPHSRLSSPNRRNGKSSFSSPASSFNTPSPGTRPPYGGKYGGGGMSPSPGGFTPSPGSSSPGGFKVGPVPGGKKLQKEIFSSSSMRDRYLSLSPLKFLNKENKEAESFPL